MSEVRNGPRELFATPADVIAAHRIVEEVFGTGVDVNYLAFPKNTGQMGDEGFRGHSVVLSAISEEKRRRMFGDQVSVKEGFPRLAEASLRITNETRAATRVVIDITPGGGYFQKAPEA